MGFIYLALAIAYVIVSAIIILLGGWIVKAFGKRPRRWYIGAAIASFLILFWDYMPTYVLFTYDCNTKAGLIVHQSLDEWRKEHPGILSTLPPLLDDNWEKENNVIKYKINQRFSYEYSSREGVLYIYKNREIIKDDGSGDILYEFINYQVRNRIEDPEKFRDYKIWLSLGSCFDKDKHILDEHIRFNGIESELRSGK